MPSTKVENAATSKSQKFGKKPMTATLKFLDIRSLLRWTNLLMHKVWCGVLESRMIRPQNTNVNVNYVCVFLLYRRHQLVGRPHLRQHFLAWPWPWINSWAGTALAILHIVNDTNVWYKPFNNNNNNDTKGAARSHSVHKNRYRIGHSFWS